MSTTTAVESEVEQIDHVLGEEYEHMPVPLLGILVPPIGAIILVDQYMVRANSEATSEWRIVPFIAWAAGSLVAFFVSELVAFFVSEYAPQYSTAISAFVVAAVVYGVSQSLAAPKTQYAS
jgi:cytosine permease